MSYWNGVATFVAIMFGCIVFSRIGQLILAGIVIGILYYFGAPR